MDEKKTILVTGGAGFIGSHLVDVFIEVGHRVIVVDDLSTGSIEYINPKAVFYEQSVTDPALEAIFEKEKPDWVSHHAAQSSAATSMTSPLLDAKVNIEGLLNVLENSRRHDVEKIVFASSAAIYGDPEYLPLDEEHPCHPMSPYGISKLSSEYYLEHYRLQYGLPFVALRYSNVYGPRQSANAEGGVIAIFNEKFDQKAPLTIYGDGEQTRDFIHVEDIVTANMKAFSYSDSGKFNIGTGREFSINQLYQEMASVRGFDLAKTTAHSRAGDINRSCFTIDRARDLLGWSPSITIEEGLSKF